MIVALGLTNIFYLELFCHAFACRVYVLTVAYSPCSGSHQSTEYIKKSISDQQSF